MSDFNEMLNKIRKCMTNAGDFVIGNSVVKNADPALLLPTEETLFEHWQVYQGAISYFGFLLNQARDALKQAEEQLQEKVLCHRGRLHELAKNKYQLSRPTREDVLLIGVIEGVESLDELRKNVQHWQSAVNDLETWLKSWEKKSFVLNGMMNSVIGDRNSITMQPRKSPVVPT